MAIRKRITKIQLCIGGREIYEVGGLYFHESSAHGKVTRIKQKQDGFVVYNDKGGNTFYASHYVDPDSIVKE